jgi:GNAT superfamily N-acetyltransferase
MGAERLCQAGIWRETRLNSIHTPSLSYLISPSNAEEWAAYHRIRRKVLFENRGLFGKYDPDHPDEHKSGNFPGLLISGSDYIGTVRIDMAGEIAYLRRVAIDDPWQRRGFGRVMIRLAESFALDQGARRIESIVAADAVPFYEKCGYRPVDPIPIGASNIHIYKDLAAA